MKKKGTVSSIILLQTGVSRHDRQQQGRQISVANLVTLLHFLSVQP